jgi:hypothetical protein
MGGVIWFPKPDILIGDKGQTIAVRTEDGRLNFLSAAPYSQTARIWLIKNGEEPVLKNIGTNPPALIRVKKKKISLSSDTCRGADICLHHYPKDQTYLIYVADKIKVKTP